MTTAPAPEAEFKLPDGCDATSNWRFDSMHFPHALPPLSQDVMRAVMQHAFGVETAIVNGYAFMKDFAPPPPTQEVIEKGAACIWVDDFAPRIAVFCDRVRHADYESLSAEELASGLPALFAEAGEIYRYTMIVVFAFMGPTLAMVEFSEQALGPDGPLLVASLLQGFENETSAAGAGLDELTALAATLPEVSRALRDGRVEDLAAVPGGAEFLAGLGAFLDEYGWRVDDWTLVHVPTWAENPSTPLRLIGSFLGRDARSPDASMGRSVAVREAAERKVRSRLSGETLAQLMGMLEVAKPHVAISEGRARWQLTIVGSLRVPIIALGRKLEAAGALDDPNDAFFLSTAELSEAAAAPSAVTKVIVQQRKEELESRKLLTPPPFLGTPPATEDMPPELQSHLRRFFGLGVEPSADAEVITGNAASSGVVRGRARVIRELADADRLEPGDILVCGMTAPPWTPLFAIAAGVVTDTGGVLSHSAICAREYSIPCVVGTMVGTSLIRDGSFITVDGERGLVQLER